MSHKSTVLPKVFLRNGYKQTEGYNNYTLINLAQHETPSSAGKD